MKQKTEPVRMASIVSLGCPKNLVDSEVAAGGLLRAGFGLTPDPEEANLLFINTCAFLKSARDEAEEAIGQAEEWKKQDPSNRKILVSGCLNEWKEAASLQKLHPLVDLWARLDLLPDTGKIARNLFAGKLPEDPEGLPRYLYDHATDRLQLTPAHYAYLKIADGCDNCCAYCLIPSIRGHLRSRMADSVVKEAELMLQNGVKELIVTAQDTGAFRREKGEKNALAGLLKRLDRFGGEYWIRLMYLHPSTVTEELCDTLAECRHLARCVEMPIQHISDRILLAMGRHAGEAATRQAVKWVRTRANCRLRTTLMTGFPGETREDFRKLLEFTEEARFARMGSFAFSPEAGTRAAAMPGQVSPLAAERRRKELMDLQEKISGEYNRNLQGKTIRLLLDEKLPRTGLLARSEDDAPEIDNSIRITGPAAGFVPGTFADCIIRRTSAYGMTAEIAGKKGKK